MIRGSIGLAAALWLAAAGTSLAAPARPFPQATTPQYGALRPSGTAAAANAVVAQQYDAWKAKYVKSACGGRKRYVEFAPDGATMAVSEGMGYGLLLAALMAGHDAEAQALFDDFYRFARSFPSARSNYLMGWNVTRDCRMITGWGDGSATDGDLDIAYALLLADKQWGSGAEINYAAEARSTIAAIKQWNVHPSLYHVVLGDWALGDSARAMGTRTSDQIPAFFRAYATATGDATWTTVRNRSYQIVSALQSSHAPATGLLPDFAVGMDGTPRPASPGFLEGGNDGNYGWNALRDPWRLSLDAMQTGDARAKDAVTRISRWLKTSTGGDAERTRGPYALNGQSLVDYSSIAFASTFAVAVAAAGEDQAFLDALWNRLKNRAIGGGYYEDALKMLSMIALTGNWWDPDTAAAPQAGTVPQTGLWWNAAQGGRGYGIEYNPSSGTLFVGTFIYGADPTRPPVWYVSTCAYVPSTGNCSGALQQFANGQSLNGGYRPPTVLGSAGTLGVSFSSATSGTLTLPSGTTVPITRFPFANPAGVTAGDAGTAETGWWWNAAESGRGWFMEVQKTASGQNSVYLIGYMYDDQGQANWHVATGPMTTPALFESAMALYHGGSPISATSDTAPTSMANLGAVAVQFTSTGTAVLSLGNGRQIPLTRFRP